MTAPMTTTVETDVQPVAAAGNTLDTVIGQAPYACTVTGVKYIPAATITGAATNNRTVSVVNKGQAGAGTAAVATLNFASGTNATANDDRVITLSGTAADLVLAAGDTLQWRSVPVGTGITDPGGRVVVTLSRTSTQ